MPVNAPKEVFVLMLSNVRQCAERASNAFQELTQAAQDPDIKEVLEARAYVNEKILATLDQCFKLIGVSGPLGILAS
jgi:ferritin-like metal-binding protein YciE